MECAFVGFLKLRHEGGISQVLYLFDNRRGGPGGELEFVLDESPLRTGGAELGKLLCVVVGFVHLRF